MPGLAVLLHSLLFTIATVAECIHFVNSQKAMHRTLIVVLFLWNNRIYICGTGCNTYLFVRCALFVSRSFFVCFPFFWFGCFLSATHSHSLSCGNGFSFSVFSFSFSFRFVLFFNASARTHASVCKYVTQIHNIRSKWEISTKFEFKSHCWWIATIKNT